MKALRFAIGLVYDDIWLFGGVLVSAAVGFLIVAAGAKVFGGIAFLVLVLASLALSSLRSARRR